MYLFRELFPNLIKHNILGQFWRGIYRKYVVKMTKLDAKKMEYIVREKANKGRGSIVISQELGISKRRVDQVYRYYADNGYIPSLAKPGRKKGGELTEDKVNLILNSYSKYLVNALYLQHMIRADTGININKPQQDTEGHERQRPLLRCREEVEEEELDKVRKGALQRAVAHRLAPIDKGPKVEGPVADHLRGRLLQVRNRIRRVPYPYVGIFGKGAEGGNRQVWEAGRDAVGPRLHLLRHI